MITVHWVISPLMVQALPVVSRLPVSNCIIVLALSIQTPSYSRLAALNPQSPCPLNSGKGP